MTDPHHFKKVTKFPRLTAMYDLVPTNEFAIELISCPLTPKSHSLISPLELTRMLEGFTSIREREGGAYCIVHNILILTHTLHT